MVYASAEELKLKLLPHSDVPQQLSKLFPGASMPLEALGEAITADRARAYLTRTLKGEKESFLLSTPRHRVRFFKDRYDAHTVIVLSAEDNTLYRWEEDRKKGSPWNVIWTARPSQVGPTNGRTLDRTIALPMSGAPAGFWDFWGSLLDKERDALNELIGVPGWPYSKRRVGLNGGFEFKVGDDRDAILQTCGSSFLIPRDGEPETGGRGQNFLLFEIQHSEASEWIAGVPRRTVDLTEIPPQAHIRVDWIGTASELKRRQDALHRLRSGLSALPSLGEMLPDGPKTSPPPVLFTPILPTPYNTEQNEAIGKALVSGSLTCILGPPGTGKTSVIAEIAAQLADTGKRVLISSQSNLAVDNALEKVTNLKQIFAIRIGRPESVKLNPELLLDNASLRYRDLLLAGSLKAESAATLGIEELREQLPSEAVLDTWIEQSKRYRQLKAALAQSGETHRLCQARHDQAISDLDAAEVHLSALCLKNGISVAEAEDLLRTTRELIKAGVAPITVHSKRTCIVSALADRSKIVNLAGKSARLIQVRSEVKNLNAQLLRNQGYIADFVAKEEFLGNARKANASYDREKAKAGFFKSMWLGITGPPHDLVNFEQQLSRARTLRDEADRLLPTLRRKLDALDLERASCEEESLALIRTVRDGVQALPSEIQSIADGLHADLELATTVELAGGLRYLPVLDQHEVIDKAMASLKRAITAAQLRRSEFTAAEATLLAATRDARATPDPAEHLSSVAILLRLDLPEDLETWGMSLAHNETEEAFFRTLRSRHKDASSRVARWSATVAALDIYRARLNQPAIDLQRAVLSEANVIGATCSGIAGARDFDADFDCVIVDEAGRTTPLDLLMPIVRGKSVVLVGDHKQLPPFIGDQLRDELTDIEKTLVEQSIFETIYESSHQDRRQALRKQYRMAPAICDIVREISYQDPGLSLETEGAALDRCHSIPGLGAIHWIKPTGPKNATRSSGGRGLVNQAEVEAAVDIFRRIASHQTVRSGDPYLIGIISMYKQQSQAIERAIGGIATDYPAVHVEIGTVDSFQGREKDAVILTFSETDPRRRRFFYDRRRLNVALSRTKELLVIVGSLDMLGRTPSVFGVDNPLYELRFLIESGLNICSSSESFHA